MRTRTPSEKEQAVHLPAGLVTLEGNLNYPENAQGVVLFAHGSGSSRHSPRNQAVAQVLRRSGFATLLLDLLTVEEEAQDRYSAHLRFDIKLLAERLAAATEWLRHNEETKNLNIGYFGASTGAGAALVAAAQLPESVGAVVSRGGRPDLAGAALLRVRAPTLLLVGSLDVPVIAMNQEALARLDAAEKKLVIIPGASHLFEEPGTLDEVARLAAGWFTQHLVRPPVTPGG
jgi:dienelactone hydrolase